VAGRTIFQVERVEVGVELGRTPSRSSHPPPQGKQSSVMYDSERERIFGDWLAGHKGILFKVVHAYAFEHADRQDLFQEIVIQVWRSVDAFRGESSVPTWIYRVALNTAMAWTRKEDRHQRGKQPLAVVEGLLTTASAAPDPRVEWLYRQIAQLKDVDRSVALLLLDGFSYKEIAAIVGITESNVGVKINRIKSALIDKRAEQDS
jgi:RNA polymerase sigma-70 factor (ECF subfamily)